MIFIHFFKRGLLFNIWRSTCCMEIWQGRILCFTTQPWVWQILHNYPMARNHGSSSNFKSRYISLRLASSFTWLLNTQNIKKHLLLKIVLILTWIELDDFRIFFHVLLSCWRDCVVVWNSAWNKEVSFKYFFYRKLMPIALSLSSKHHPRIIWIVLKFIWN